MYYLGNVYLQTRFNSPDANQYQNFASCSLLPALYLDKLFLEIILRVKISYNMQT